MTEKELNHICDSIKSVIDKLNNIEDVMIERGGDALLREKLGEVIISLFKIHCFVEGRKK